MSKTIHVLTLFGIVIALLLSGCQTGPVVVVATPIPRDATFRTYRHPSGVFTLRLPADWSVRDVSRDDAIRVEFSPPGNTGLPLTVYVVNTGTVLDSASLLKEIDSYQAVVNGDAALYKEVSRNAQGDGSWRLTGVRQTPIGPRQLNTFLQADKTFFSAIEADITGLSDTAMQTLQTVINTFRVDPTVKLQAANLQPLPGASAVTSSGVLVFGGLYSWTNSQGIFIVNGIVTNQSGGSLEAVRITAVLYDAQDNVLSEQANVLPGEVLEDKATSPFSISFRNGKPSQAVRFELQGVARNAEYSLKTYLGQDKFLLANDKATYNASGLLTVEGDVVNKTQAEAKFVRATVTIFDEQSRVVATDSVFLSKPDLLPNEPSHFTVTFFELGGNVNRYVITVEGKTE